MELQLEIKNCANRNGQFSIFQMRIKLMRIVNYLLTKTNPTCEKLMSTGYGCTSNLEII